MKHVALSFRLPLRVAVGVIATSVALLIALPANADTITVTNTLDSGPGSVRQAVLDASTSDMIVFDFTVFSTLFTVTLTSGQIEVTQSLTIDGAGVAVFTPTISGNNTDRILHVGAGAYVMLHHLQLTEGNCFTSNGGAIYNANTSAFAWIAGDELSANVADEGGAMYNTGWAEICDSVIDHNTAISGGGITNNQGHTVIRASTITANRADCVCGAAGIQNDAGLLETSDSLVSENGSVCFSIGS
jgi:hypothetical protein